jgi:hypothetical protein
VLVHEQNSTAPNSSARRRHVPEQLVAAPIGAGVHAADDVGVRARLLLEIALDDGFELLERLEQRDVALGEKVEGQHEATVPVDDEALHGILPARGVDSGTVRGNSGYMAGAARGNP